jgi:hypothetical protein
MRLIRLTTEDEKAVFRGEYTDNITLPPNGKVALQNLSLESAPATIVLNSQNNTITTSISTGPNITIDLPSGTYDKDNYEDLLAQIKRLLNFRTGYLPSLNNTRELGVEWKADVDEQNKVYIEYKRGPHRENEDLWILGAPGDPVVERTGAGVYSQVAAGTDTSGYDKCMLMPEFISRGCGYTRCRIHTLDASAVSTEEENGFTLALTLTDLRDKEPSDITLSQIKYGIHVTKDALSGTYPIYTIEDGVRQLASSEAIYNGPGDTDNDQFEIILTGSGIVNLNRWESGAGAPDPLDIYTLSPTEKELPLYPLIIFHGRKNFAKVNLVRQTLSPYATPIGNAIKELTLAPIAPSQPYQSNFLLFESPSLANFFGYENARQPLDGFISASVYTYTADNQFDPTDKADAFLVILDNIAIDSYDSYVSGNKYIETGRKNILAVVPKSNATGEVIYEPNYPTFIDLKNKEELLIRNIKARVVKSDYTPFSMRGLATLTILISD